MTMTVFGIDTSLSGTAIAQESTTGEIEVERYATKRVDVTVRARVDRIRSIVRPIKRRVERAAQLGYVHIFIENYSFASPAGKGQAGTEHRAELGGVLRHELIDHVRRFEEVAPATLKKFVRGKGVGTKTAMASDLARIYNRSFDFDDDADAFALMKFGMHLLDLSPEKLTKDRRAAIDAFLKRQEERAA